MRLRQFCLSVLFCSGLSTLQAQTPTDVPAVAAAEEELVGPIKLPDADIDTVLGLLEIYTGRIILRPQQLPSANYHLVIDRKIPKAEAILALETVLALNQVGVTPLGDKFLKVVALAQLKTEAPEMITESTLKLPPSGRVAAKLFQLDFLRVNEFVPLISPLMSPGVANGIVPLEKSNAVLITDSISNLQRVELLLQTLDAPTMTGLTPKFYTLREAKASDVVNKLRAMFQGPLQAQLGSATSYSADDRTNQIVLLSDPRQQKLFDDLIARLDVKAEPNTRNEVIYLKHASAKDVAPLLSQLVSGQNTAAQRASGNNARNPQVVQPAADSAENAGEAALAGLTTESNEFSSLITILPDERSNAVVVSGTVDDIRLLRGLIDKIDILLAQVRIEVVIAEVTLNDNDKSGLQKLNLTFGQDGGVTRITKFDGVIQGVTVTNGVTNPLSFVASLGDNGARNDVRVLSSPTIVTTHNKEAQILVGEKRPLITGTQSSIVTAGATPVTSSTVSYTDIAIDLKVTPLIGEDGSIQLKIDQKVDDITGNVVIDNNEQPIIGRRQATSFVNVKDSEMIVLGGLQRNRVSNNRTKLGFFYELPIISHIFGARTKGLERTELLLFIRPHVIRPADGTADTIRKIDELSNREQINQYLIDPSKQPEKPGSEKADKKKSD
ncbi:MAG: type II secretory pathway, component PulD [Opitutus sp.]|nr:type II secretory pathway, component PulD [Opitutus sp.]